MKTFDPGCCDVSPSEFGSLVDLMLTTAIAMPMTSTYPVEFGREPPVILQVDHEYGVLEDWKGRVLTQGFTEEEE